MPELVQVKTSSSLGEAPDTPTGSKQGIAESGEQCTTRLKISRQSASSGAGVCGLLFALLPF